MRQAVKAVGTPSVLSAKQPAFVLPADAHCLRSAPKASQQQQLHIVSEQLPKAVALCYESAGLPAYHCLAQSTSSAAIQCEPKKCAKNVLWCKTGGPGRNQPRSRIPTQSFKLKYNYCYYLNPIRYQIYLRLNAIQ